MLTAGGEPKRRGVLKEDAGRARGEVWGVVDFALKDMRCLARDCAGDEVARKFVAPALELMMLDKAKGEHDKREAFDREEALLRFGEMYATAIAGDGYVGPRGAELAVGGELGGGAALLRLAALHLLNELLPDGLRFGVHTYVVGDRNYDIAAYGGDAARLKRILAVSAPSAGGRYLSPKFEGFVERAQVEVRLDEGSIRRTQSGHVAADLTISEGGVAVKYNVYLRRDDILLRFDSTDRGRAELAARLLKLAGVNAEVERVGGEDEWRVRATTNKLAAGRRELRDALAEIVREAVENGWVDAGRAERWLEKLERGRTVREGWPKYKVRLKEGALEVRYETTNPDNIEREAQRLSAMGLKEGKHFAVKKPEGGEAGYVSILKEGLERAAWLSIHGSEEQRRLAARFVEYILQRAGEEGEDVRKKALEIVKRGKEVGSLRLADVKGAEVDVGGKRYVVTVLGGGARFEEGRGGRKLLRIQITAEVGGVRSEYTITFSRRGARNEAVGYATAKADAERFAALVEALTGKRPRVYRVGGRIMIECGRGHLDGLARYAELAEAIGRWLEETGR